MMTQTTFLEATSTFGSGWLGVLWLSIGTPSGQPPAVRIPAVRQLRGSRLNAQEILRLENPESMPRGQTVEAEGEEYLMMNIQNGDSLSIWAVSSYESSL